MGIIRINTFDQWGTTFPTLRYPQTTGTGVAAPSPFGIVGSSSNYTLHSIANPPWNPNFSGTYLNIVGSGSPSPNPGNGFYDCVPGMYPDLILNGWFRWISGTMFVFRMNDSHSGQAFGTDWSAISMQGTSPNGQMRFDQDAALSPASIVANTWYAYEWYVKAGVTSGTPQGGYVFKLYDSTGSLLWTVSNSNIATTSSSYNLDSITLDCELGGSTPLMDFGPYAIIDPAGAGSGAMIGPLSFGSFLASADSTPLQFTPSAAGSHYPKVSVALPNSAYVEDATVGDQDAYQFDANTTGTATYQLYHQGEVTTVGARIVRAKSAGSIAASGVAHGAPVANNGIFMDIIGSLSGSLSIQAGPKVEG